MVDQHLDYMKPPCQRIDHVQHHGQRYAALKQLLVFSSLYVSLIILMPPVVFRAVSTCLKPLWICPEQLDIRANKKQW